MTGRIRTRRKKAEAREIALRAVRGQAQRHGIDPTHLSVDDAMTILDDMSRRDPELIAAQWYVAMSDRQYRLFRREWNVWRKSTRGH